MSEVLLYGLSWLSYGNIFNLTHLFAIFAAGLARVSGVRGEVCSEAAGERKSTIYVDVYILYMYY